MDVLLALPGARTLATEYGDQATLAALRLASQTLRTTLLSDAAPEVTTPAAATDIILSRAGHRLSADSASRLRRVINATGVIIHTNLGRAPLSAAARAAIDEASRDYVALEYSLDTGDRGSRHVHAERWLRELTGADAAIVANNTAAAMTVALSALAAGREVIISRGELVEIGGGFRVPDVLRASGALLREVGTTNRTRVADYAAAITDRTAALLRVHPSNFRMEGFTERPEPQALAALATRFEIPLIEDQGSGWLGFDAVAADALPTESRAVLAREPSVRDSVASGAQLVVFSGDKLLGGPQCGVIVGRQALIDEIRRHPLMRAVRVDKLTYAALEATLQAYRRGRALAEVPVLMMLSISAEGMRQRAGAFAKTLEDAGIASACRDGASTIGGGSTPGETLPTTLVAIRAADSADAMLSRLRQGDVPVIGRIVDDHVCLDLRSVPPDHEDALAAAVVRASASPGPHGPLSMMALDDG